MSSLREQRARIAWRALPAVAAALLALLVLSASALAVQDELKGGSVTMQLVSSHGLKLKPSSATLPITGGALDPIDGSGTVRVSGGFKARLAKGKTKVTIVSLTFGTNGAPGAIAAKIGKGGKIVGGFGMLSGGAVSRDGWGARITGVSASIGSKGAQALARALSGKGRKGARKSAAGRVRAGQPLGTVSAVTVPLSVAVVPGTGTLTLTTNLLGAFAGKLPQHCISLLSGGVAPISPATQELNPAVFDFPVAGGSAAPDFSAGEVLTAGGQTLAKALGLDTASGCSSAAPPVGTKLTSTELGVDFAQGFLMSTATLPTGTALRAPLATIDFSSGTRSFDSSTKTLSVSGATVNLASLAAATLNAFFPTESGNPSNDFATGDPIGTINLTGVKLR